MLTFDRTTKYLLIVLFILCCGQIPTRAESQIPFLVVSGTTYTNVVVIQKTADNVFIQHNGGIASFKVTDLNDALRSQLGLPPRPVMTNLTSSAPPNKNSTLAGGSHQERVAQAPKKIAPPGTAGKNRHSIFQSVIVGAAGILFLVILLFLSLRNPRLKETGSQAATESDEVTNVLDGRLH